MFCVHDGVDLRLFQLRYADAWSVARMLEDVFKPKDDSGPRFPFFIFSDMAQPQAKSSKINITSDDRTNSVIVTATPEILKVIERMIQQLDANPATEDTLFIYHLRNGQAQNLEFVLNILFGNITPPNQAPQDGQPPQPGMARQDGQSDNEFGGPGNSRARDRRNRAYNRRNDRFNRPGMPRVSPLIAQAINELTGRVFVVAEPDTNSLLVTTATKYQKQVRQIIEDLDRPVPQVLIKVLVAEVKHDNSADLGVDFSVLNRRESGRGQTIASRFGNAGLSTGLIVSVLESNLTATLHALAQEDKLDVLSRPYILASDNQLANILIGQSIPFITDTRITESGQQINTVQYRDIGLSLNVTPHINPDGVVILDVVPEVSQLTSQTVPISNTTFAPVIAKRSAESRIAVRDGHTVVIGGLMEDRRTANNNKIPILGDIPLIGPFLFGRNQTTKSKTELLIFLTPHVAQRPESLQGMSSDETGGTRLTPRAVQPGTFQEHMEGMRRGQGPGVQTTQPVDPVNSIDLSAPQERRFPGTQPSTAPADRG